MRFAFSTACCTLVLACSPVSGASIDASYVVGNLKELSTGAYGLLRVESDELTFRSGKVTIAAAYRNITQFEMGPAVTHPSSGPVWKRLTSKRPAYRNLTIDFKDENHGDQTMTLELTDVSAAEVYDALDIGTGRRRWNSNSQPWWGDNVWRTSRNNRDWNETPQPTNATPKAGN